MIKVPIGRSLTHLSGAKRQKEDQSTCKMALKGAMTALNLIPKKHKTQLLDAIASLAPPLKGPRKLINDVLGFRSRQAIPGKNKRRKMKRYGKGAGGVAGALVGGNGATIRTVNAPVAFARTDGARPGFFIRHLDADTILVHSVDYVDEIEMIYDAGGNNVFGVQEFNVDPTDAVVFSYVNPLLELFTKWKLKSLKVHYVHYSPTTQPGTVAITWSPDVDTLPPQNMADQVNLNAAISGAAYEDFAYEANSKQFSKDWQFISPANSTNEDDRLTIAGSVFVATDNGGTRAPTSGQELVGVGRLLFESEFILTGRRVSGLMVALGKVKSIVRHKSSTRQEKIAALTALVPELLDSEGKGAVKRQRTLAQIVGRQQLPPEHPAPSATPPSAMTTPSMIRGERLPRS